MNKAIITGRLTRDPEIRTTQSGTIVARYSLAVGRIGDGTDFIDCVAFGKGAEFADKYMRKGMKMCISGSIQTGSYKNQNGDTVRTFNIVANEQEFCESKKDNGGLSNEFKNENKGMSDDFMTVPDGELPFM